ncbi:DNA-3-methyladenine glycosylase [Melioribacter sp. Ez-97]|uniref:DNA-3-methyladenine glycosylase n=1 Tax=Melioribacter sp. Ez-97 TaxID=3423434 RepID=UPI003ED93361
MQKKLPLSFYKRDVHTVARELLGKIFVKQDKDAVLSGRIVEVEAYDGSIDMAAHSFNGKTPRNSVMFEEGGRLYVYFTYGMHYCANVVTGNVDEGCAVLIRAVEPVEGIDAMALNRYGKTNLNGREKLNLTNGPAKFCKAFGIDKTYNGLILTGEKIFITGGDNLKPGEITASKRIGIKKSTELEWRYYIRNNRYISKK